jgi:hypothetical protein
MTMDLIDGLRDMIAHNRLTQADIPDDWEWLFVALKAADQERELFRWVEHTLESHASQKRVNALAKRED